MSELNEQSTRLYRVRRTVMQMLRDRGYEVSDSELELTKEQFKESFGEDFTVTRETLGVTKVKPNEPDEKIKVFFCGKEKTAKSDITDYIETMKSGGAKCGILVVRQAPKLQGAAAAKAANLEIFVESELLVNIKQHVLVPEHIVLTPEEQTDLLERYTVRESQLPRMLVQDPMARYYGLRPGQIVKINRPSETAGVYSTYRLVV